MRWLRNDMSWAFLLLILVMMQGGEWIATGRMRASGVLIIVFGLLGICHYWAANRGYSRCDLVSTICAMAVIVAVIVLIIMDVLRHVWRL